MYPVWITLLLSAGSGYDQAMPGRNAPRHPGFQQPDCVSSADTCPNRSQLCTCHDSSVVVTCAKLLPDLIIICQKRSTWTLTRFVLYGAITLSWNGPQAAIFEQSYATNCSALVVYMLHVLLKQYPLTMSLTGDILIGSRYFVTVLLCPIFNIIWSSIAWTVLPSMSSRRTSATSTTLSASTPHATSSETHHVVLLTKMASNASTTREWRHHMASVLH